MKKNILVILSCLLIIITACGKNENLKNNAQKFKSDIKNAIDLVQSDSNITKPISYLLYDGYISGIDSNNNQKIFTVENTSIEYGVMYINEDNKIYASLENQEYCAIKEFNEDEFTIYNIDEKEKCHKFYLLDEDINLVIIPFNIETNEFYNSETISSGYISLYVQENIIDDDAVEYQWYRNEEKLKDGNVKAYTIVSDYEDADYYVEITTTEGEKIKSDSVSVKINRGV